MNWTVLQVYRLRAQWSDEQRRYLRQEIGVDPRVVESDRERLRQQVIRHLAHDPHFQSEGGVVKIDDRFYRVRVIAPTATWYSSEQPAATPEHSPPNRGVTTVAGLFAGVPQPNPDPSRRA